MVIREAAGEQSPEEASEASDAASTAALSADLSNTIFANIIVGKGLIATYSFESFEDLNAALTTFITSLEARGVRTRFKPSLQVEEVFQDPVA